jgi:hypothetical protein
MKETVPTPKVRKSPKGTPLTMGFTMAPVQSGVWIGMLVVETVAKIRRAGTSLAETIERSGGSSGMDSNAVSIPSEKPWQRLRPPPKQRRRRL